MCQGISQIILGAAENAKAVAEQQNIFQLSHKGLEVLSHPYARNLFPEVLLKHVEEKTWTLVLSKTPQV